MKTIGQILKDARVKKHLSREKLATETKIKKTFIEAIESDSWQGLPEYPVVVGFVRSIAQAVGLHEEKTVAILRRDYPPKKLSLNPKPAIASKFIWGPKITFFIAVCAVIIAVLGYLGAQYINYIKPPFLEVTGPAEDQVVGTREIRVTGRTDPEAVIRVNNQLTLVESSGDFAAQIKIFEGTEVVEVKAISRSGKETVIRRKIKPELGTSN